MGIVLVIAGLLFMVGFFNGITWVSVITGLFFFVLGVVILFNTKEDKIEQIKKRKGGKK